MASMAVASASSRSVTHSLFIDPSEDPFYDPYIETVLHMNTRSLMAIPRMNDTEFIRHLLSDDDSTFGKHTCNDRTL